MSFLTLEDVNTAHFNNQGFWWYEIDISKITTDLFTNFDVKYDGFTVSRRRFMGHNYEFMISNQTSLNIIGVCVLSVSNVIIDTEISRGNVISFITGFSTCKIMLYLGAYSTETIIPTNTQYYLVDEELELTRKELLSSVSVLIKDWVTGDEETLSVRLGKGYNLIKRNNVNVGMLFVKQRKTDFQFDCTQHLTLGEVNKVQLGTLDDYKPLGDLVGEYETTISVLYNNQTIPVTWNQQLNDYTFDLDLTNNEKEGKIRFKVIVEANDVLNTTETDVVLESSYESINTFAKLTNLFKTGGVGRITSNITVTSDLKVTKSVKLISDGKTLNMNSHKIIVPSDKTFKAENIAFTNGANTIQQEINSKVEITNSAFNNCTGVGSVIDCQVDIASLTDENDFTTILNDCTFTNNDLCILHGGNLTITGCTVNGKISDKNYPYFLYQTDGTAEITQSEFSLVSNTDIDEDIEFNTCIFVCGETATVNGLNYTQLQNKDLTGFLNTQRNTSVINVTYYYPVIEDYITLQSSNGYCHAVSNVGYVFKTNISPTRRN